jgi:hypothetical protein
LVGAAARRRARDVHRTASNGGLSGGLDSRTCC